MDLLRYLTCNQVRLRYGVCRRTVSRWVAQPELGFPQPVVINRRRYWHLEDLVAWEQSRRGAA